MASAAARQMIQVIFRYDDCNSESSTALEYQLIEIFEQTGIPLTFGVTPFITSGEVDDPTPCPAIPLNAEKIVMLRHALDRLGGEVALHGYSHQTVQSPARGQCSEFSEVSFERQSERLSNGRLFLEQQLGASVTTLIPPWNSYDANTLKAAAEVGITAVSADLEGLAPPNSSLRFIPATCTLAGLKQAVRWARTTADDTPLIVVVFHPFDFEQYARPRPLTIEELRELLHWVAEQGDIRTETIAGLALGTGDFSSARLNRYQTALRRRQRLRLPARLARRRVYTSAKASRGYFGRAVMCAAGLSLLILLASLAPQPWVGGSGEGASRWGGIEQWLAMCAALGIAVSMGGLRIIHRRFIAAIALLAFLG